MQTDLQRRVTVLQGVACGERAVEADRTLTHDQAKARLGRWLNDLRERAARGRMEDFDRVLAMVPDGESEPDARIL